MIPPPAPPSLGRAPARRVTLPGALVALIAFGCASDRSAERAELAAIDARHRAEAHAFEAERARVRREADLSVRDFGPLGELHLRNVELIGWPSRAWLRVEFTYVNTGGATDRVPLVKLAIGDPATGETVSATEELLVPFRLTLGRGSTYSSWLEVPTDGFEQRPGWKWDVRLEPHEPVAASAAPALEGEDRVD